MSATKKTFYGCPCGRMFGTEAEALDCETRDIESAEFQRLEDEWRSLTEERWELSHNDSRRLNALVRRFIARSRRPPKETDT